MLLAKPTQLSGLGDLRGTMYDFENSGDILPKHVHTDNNVHITIVARGKIKAYSHDWELVAVAGQLLDFRPNEPHEIMALEDNSRIFNIIKKHGGVSNDYQIQAEESSVIDAEQKFEPLTIEITELK